MFGKMVSAPLFGISLISARVPLISNTVSAHCQAILLAVDFRQELTRGFKHFVADNVYPNCFTMFEFIKGFLNFIIRKSKI